MVMKCIHPGNAITASGMGIIDYLFDHSDLKFLLIDEIDKLSKKDQKVLLNVMETGILSDVKAKQKDLQYSLFPGQPDQLLLHILTLFHD